MTDKSLPHNTQVQEWQAALRNDYTKKIKPPEQYLPELPIKYNFTLEDRYKQYKVDNRNLPFEQPEQGQNFEGVRTIPFHYGTNLYDAINELMMFSKSVGNDITSDESRGFRSTNTVLRQCSGQYLVNTKIDSYIIPVNSNDDKDTGPGEGVIDGPLVYSFQDPEAGHKQIISLSFNSNVTPLNSPLEVPTEGQDDIGVVHGNREQQSMQRKPKSGDFFDASYTGLRSTVSPFKTSGVENSNNASVISNYLSHNNIEQSTRYLIEVVGNPYIVNDINRNPLDVIEGKGNGAGRWKYILYDMPEFKPMYCHMTVFMNPEKALAGETSVEVDTTYYYKGYLHISSIVTQYSMGYGFSHIITALRTGDGI